MPINKFVDFNKKFLNKHVSKKLHESPKGAKKGGPKNFTSIGKVKKFNA